MSRLLIKLLGLDLLFLGIYFLGQNIIFATGYYPYFYSKIPAIGSFLAIMAGVMTLIFFRKETENLGWILLGVGIVLVVFSGGVILKPTSLWNFFVAFAALVAGYKMLTQGRINF
ncbi:MULTISPECIES: hypothetical protein [Calothrix]|uniref:Uncharacterized protein n=2 Tax=Calothrix TaxID=1186 RepID=A0ABR8ACZ5_9CYAN|nr:MULTISPECIES: hypothetical protein [Calothrix]MBD2197774.1 hypothetical protein [Calothrix parietina FACHB-288]MBD2226178.1 hypothetical protein [Calothrix anomala FACHB-343]